MGTRRNQGGPDVCTSAALLGSGWIKPSWDQHDGRLRLEIPVYQSLKPCLHKSFCFSEQRPKKFFSGADLWSLLGWGGQSTHGGRERKEICDNLLYSQVSHHATSEWKRRMCVAVCQDLTLASDDEMSR